jgi:pimeloyl-ACP methyl ester carboxylesterase
MRDPDATDLDERDVEVGPLRLSVLEAGQGGLPLLLVHGFTGAKEDFGDFVEPLAADGWHVVAPDLRGHGRSDAPPAEADYSIDVFGADVLALLDALGWDRCAVLGHSMGGMITERLLIAHPERFAAAILMDTHHRAPTAIDPDMAAAAAHVVRERGLAELARLQAERGDVLSTPAHRRLVAERPGYAEFGDRKLLAASPAMYASLAVGITSQTDQLPALAALDLPVLVLVGALDGPFLAASRRMAEAVPGARLVTIPDAGHSPQFENPDAWWEAVHTFLDEVRPRFV